MTICVGNTCLKKVEKFTLCDGNITIGGAAFGAAAVCHVRRRPSGNRVQLEIHAMTYTKEELSLLIDELKRVQEAM